MRRWEIGQVSANNVEELLAAQARIIKHLRQDETELAEVTLRQNEHALTARRLGLKWIDIADALDMPRTTAVHRFKPYVDAHIKPKRGRRRFLPF